MAKTIPTIEPTTFAAGDTVKWTKALADFLATDGWTLKYFIRGAKALDLTAETSGTDFLSTISATDSAALDPGEYAWTARVSNGDEVYTVGSGSFTITPDLSIQTEGYDSRSQTKRTLDKLRDALEGLSSKKVASKTINGNTYTLKNLNELITAITKLQAEYEQELATARIKKGLGSGRFIKSRMLR